MVFTLVHMISFFSKLSFISSQKESFLTLTLCCPLLQAAWLWSCRVSRSLLHPSWKKGNEKKETVGEVHPQRDRYVMERLVERYFERGGGKEEERLSHSVRASERKQKFFYSRSEADCWI